MDMCDGLCVTAADVGLPEYGNAVAYPHPGCPAHAPGQRCLCQVENCMSYTHLRDRWGRRLDLGREN